MEYIKLRKDEWQDRIDGFNSQHEKMCELIEDKEDLQRQIQELKKWLEEEIEYCKTCFNYEDEIKTLKKVLERLGE